MPDNALPQLVPEMLPLFLGGLLGLTGGAKLLRPPGTQAAPAALERIMPSARAAALALRAVGAVELVLAAAVLLRPMSPAVASGTAVLGACFIGYLTYAKLKTPESSCGCSGSRYTPMTWRSFARAGLVATGGGCCALARTPWWAAIGHRPAVAAVVAVLVAAVFGIVSADPCRLWLLPLRRARLRLFGHPLAGTSGEVSVDATVELLESSLAWQAAAPIVRSSLLDHWDADGWRILRYSGVHEGADRPRPVSVVFALDAAATADPTTNPVVRVSVVDEERGHIMAGPALDLTTRPREEYAPVGANGTS